MQPVKPLMDMQLSKSAVQYQYKNICSDKNCQSTSCYRKPEYTKYDKNYQSKRCFSFKKKVSSKTSVWWQKLSICHFYVKSESKGTYFLNAANAKDCLKPDWDTPWSN